MRRGSQIRSSAILIFGAGLNGIFAAIAMWLAGRALGLIAFEALAQLWTLWGLTATGAVFAFQQWEVARSAAIPAGQRMPLPTAINVTLLVATMATFAVTYVSRHTLFGTGSVVWPLAAATLPVGTTMTGLAYANLARARSTKRLAALMASENLVRLAATAVLTLAAAEQALFSLIVPAGFALSTSALLLRKKAASDDGVPLVGLRRGHRLPTLTFIGFARTFLLFGGPLLLGAAGGEAAVVSALFLMLIIPRVPVLLLNALIPSIIVQADAAARGERSAMLLGGVYRLASTGFVLAGAAAVLGLVAGDGVASVLFNAGGQISPTGYALLGAAVGLTMAGSVTNILLISLGHTTLVAGSWAAVVGSGGVLAAFGTLADVEPLAAWMVVASSGVLLTHVVKARLEQRALMTDAQP